VASFFERRQPDQRSDCDPRIARGAERAAMPFEVKGRVYGRLLKANADTAKEVFAIAVEWQVANCAWDLSISDGSRSFTVAEFAWAMASHEIAATVRKNAKGQSSHRLR